jgi:glycosyltransferase involved in cell wall biosynthesis
LIRAISVVHKDIPDVTCYIIGEGKERNYLENLAGSLNILDNNIKFLGKIPHYDVARFLKLSDIYVSTSLSDGVSNSLLEAMSCGLPVIVSAIKANRGWVTESINGFLFPIRDYHALAAKIIYLLNNKMLREKFGATNRNIVRDHAEYKVQMSKANRSYIELLKDFSTRIKNDASTIVRHKNH